MATIAGWIVWPRSHCCSKCLWCDGAHRCLSATQRVPGRAGSTRESLLWHRRVTQLSLSSAAIDFGATTLFRDITFTISAGERWGVVGRNGTGKTTLFKLMTGELAPTRGSVSRGSGITLSLLGQHRDFGVATTVWEAAAGPFAELLALEQSLTEQAHALATASDPAALERYGRDLGRFEHEGGYTIAPRADAVLRALGFYPVCAWTQPLGQLSGGERGRVGLARQLGA